MKTHWNSLNDEVADYVNELASTYRLTKRDARNLLATVLSSRVVANEIREQAQFVMTDQVAA